MKIKGSAILMLSALSLGSTLAHATTTTSGGTVHFKGEVVNGACAVDAGSIDQTVQLGQVRSASLAATGQTSSAVGFNIQLNDCDITTLKTAAIGFSGAAVNSTNPNILGLQGSAAGGATNVGVQILDNTGSPMTLDGSAAGAKYTLSEGTNILPFQARYFATGVATAGTANADATFKVQYD
ncbi:type 1 fimbrial major subunit FimA [Pseudomonas chlororaphis]|uniref:Type-1 fimbrial protein subunit A n=1 Tax=Pseudomonas chlororaphis TaxID=587753 RepID=A0A1Q8EM82_9PSED|nr:type 1 fimbrial major subunit FimA [Pseudomonas chlororaphis]OLF52898.1 type-1 fimbrial protein subunit A [Pseudomonas chlororaphis]